MSTDAHVCGYDLQALSENPFLSSTALWKQITFTEDDDAEPTVTAAELAWKDTDEAKEAKEEASFFEVRLYVSV